MDIIVCNKTVQTVINLLNLNQIQLELVGECEVCFAQCLERQTEATRKPHETYTETT